MKTKACVSGTFDPIHNGHLFTIESASHIFQSVVIFICENRDKKTLFTLEERVRMVDKSVKELGLKNVDIHVLNDGIFIVEEALKHEVTHIVRGLRNGIDLEYEKTMYVFNKKKCSKIETIFMLAPEGMEHISSSAVRALIKLQNFEELAFSIVPSVTFKHLIMKTNSLFSELKNLGAIGDEYEFWDTILSPYLKKDRSYHNWCHIFEMLREFETVAHLVKNPTALKTAILGHDFVIDTWKYNSPNPPIASDEERSAYNVDLLLIEYNLPEDFRKQVKEFILATIHNNSLPNDDAKILVDLDLLNFGKSYQEFLDKGRLVKEEWPWVPEKKFWGKRKDILKNFYTREGGVYKSEHFKDMHEAQAVANLRKFCEQLEEDPET